MKARSIFGVIVHDVTYEESLAAIDRFIQLGGPHMVTTPNPEFVMTARENPEFRALLGRAALAIPDGIGLLWAAQLCGKPFREHVRGTDLVIKLAERSVSAEYRWFLLGAAPGVADRAAEALRRRAPGIRIVGTYAGGAGPEGDEDTRAAIAKAGPVEILLVAYGAPLQERWLARNLELTGIPVGIGVGGVFNYLAGIAPRAPVWMRRLELEWLHRLVTQPWRWRRQLALPRFVLVTLAARFLPGRRRPVVSVDERLGPK